MRRLGALTAALQTRISGFVVYGIYGRIRNGEMGNKRRLDVRRK